MKRVPADAPRCRVTTSRLADDAACLVRLAVYRSLLPHVLRLACAGSSPRRGGGRYAGCWPARDCRGAGRMTGRTSSSPAPAGMPMTWAWRRPSWSWRCWPRPGSRSPSRSTTPCSGGAGRTCGPQAGFMTARPRGRPRPDTGNDWVIAAIVVKLPMMKRPVALPVLAKPVIKDTNAASRPWLACRPAQMLAGALPGRATTWWPTPPTPEKNSRSSLPASPGPP